MLHTVLFLLVSSGIDVAIDQKAQIEWPSSSEAIWHLSQPQVLDMGDKRTCDCKVMPLCMHANLPVIERYLKSVWWTETF